MIYWPACFFIAGKRISDVDMEKMLEDDDKLFTQDVSISWLIHAAICTKELSTKVSGFV